MKINGIILAAGFGSRLAPLTEHVPKPVLPVCGEPMLLRTLRRLKDAGADRIAVNTHHLHEQVEDCVRNSPFADSVRLFHEPEILGTAGPLVNAKELLSDCDYFILHNSDVITDIDLKEMLEEHIRSGASLSMALIDGPENRVQVKGDRVVDILHRRHPDGIGGTEDLTYACVSVFSQDFFEALPEQVRPCSFLDVWLKALETGKTIHAFRPKPEYLWYDIGSFRQYFEAHRLLMEKEPLIIGRNCNVSQDAVFTGFNAVGNNCTIPAGTHLHNCIVLDGTTVQEGYSGWEVHGNGFRIHRDEKELRELKIFREETGSIVFRSLPEQGSDRRFFRVLGGDRSSRILMLSNEHDKDFDRFLSLGTFFHRHKLRTPEIFRSVKEEYSVLIEDLGNGTLYELCHGKPEQEILPLYEKTVEALADFQERCAQAVGEEDLACRIFTRQLLRWESSYFHDNFLCGICGMKLTEQRERMLFAEYDGIADAAERMAYVPIHRDFQSQNILWTDGTIRFVDFQGFRLGPLTYDLAALIKDPYMALSKSLRDRLYSKAETLLGHKSPAFERDCLIGALQRNMQALGAYGFLSLKKGKTRYLDYAEPCLNLLIEGLEEISGLSDAEVRPGQILRICRTAREILPERLALLKGKKI